MKCVKRRSRVRQFSSYANDGKKMSKSKNAFDWNDGTPSIWQRDRELKKLLIGQEWGRKTQAKIGIASKQQVKVYSKAKSST